MATIKQKRAAKIKQEHPEKPMGKVMIEAGFSPKTALNPRDLTESKGWKELMEDFLPDKLLASKHKEFLESPRVVTTYQRGEITNEVEETSPQAVKALDMAYKLKGYYKNNDINVQALVLNVSSAASKKYGVEPSAGTNSQ